MPLVPVAVAAAICGEVAEGAGLGRDGKLAHPW